MKQQQPQLRRRLAGNQPDQSQTAAQLLDFVLQTTGKNSSSNKAGKKGGYHSSFYAKSGSVNKGQTSHLNSIKKQKKHQNRQPSLQQVGRAEEEKFESAERRLNMGSSLVSGAADGFYQTVNPGLSSGGVPESAPRGPKAQGISQGEILKSQFNNSQPLNLSLYNGGATRFLPQHGIPSQKQSDSSKRNQIQQNSYLLKDLNKMVNQNISIPIRKSYSKLSKNLYASEASKTIVPKREGSKQGRYQSRQGNASKLDKLNLTLQGLTSTQGLQQTTKASTKASKAQLNKTELNTKSTSGALKNVQNSALKKRAQAINSSYNSTKMKVPALANSNDKMPAGGSKVQINNYFALGTQNLQKGAPSVKSDIKRKRISQNLQSNGVLQPNPGVQNYVAKQPVENQNFCNTLNLTEMHNLLLETGLQSSQNKKSGLQNSVQKERKSIKNYQKLKEHQYTNSSFLNNQTGVPLQRKQSTGSSYTAKASQKRRSNAGINEDAWYSKRQNGTPKRSKQQGRRNKKDSLEQDLLSNILTIYREQNNKTVAKARYQGSAVQTTLNQTNPDPSLGLLSNKNASFESQGVNSGKHRPNTNLALYLKTSQAPHNLGAPPVQRRSSKGSAVAKKKSSVNPNTTAFQQKQVFSPFRQYRESVKTDHLKTGNYNGGPSQASKKRTNSGQAYAAVNLQELQNRTQPLPKTLLEMANAEAAMMGSEMIEIEDQGHLPEPRTVLAGERAAEVEILDIMERTRQATQSPPMGSCPKSNDRYRENRGAQLAVQVQDSESSSESSEHKVEGRFRNTGQAQAKNRPKPSSALPKTPAYRSKKVILYEAREDADSDSDEYCDSESELEEFTFGDELGQGAYAVVKHALHNASGEQFAIKIYDKSQLTDINRQRSVRREIKLLERMNHSNIAQIYHSYETEEHVYLVMELVTGGSLHGYLKSFPNRQLPEEEARRIFFQLMSALSYCHSKCITHRDIKLENVLLDENKDVKLIDFGFSTCIPNDKKIKIFCGTPSYMAPEIVKKTEYAGPPADIWASAVLLYALLNGCFPYRGATDAELYRKICRGTYAMPNQSVSRKFEKLLMKLFNCNADTRPSAEAVLADSWVQGQNEVRSSNSRFEVQRSSTLAEKKLQLLNLSNEKEQTQQASDVANRLNKEAFQAYYNTNGPNEVSPSANIRTGQKGNLNPFQHPQAIRQGQSASPQRVDPQGNPKVLFAPPIVNKQDFNQTQPVNFATIASNQQTQATAGNIQSGENTYQDPESLVSVVAQYDQEVIQQIERMGYPQHLIIEKLDQEDAQFCNLYLKLKQENRSSSLNNRIQKPHQAAVFPNYVPSIGSDQKKGVQKLRLPSTSAFTNGQHQTENFSSGSYGFTTEGGQRQNVPSQLHALLLQENEQAEESERNKTTLKDIEEKKWPIAEATS